MKSLEFYTLIVMAVTLSAVMSVILFSVHNIFKPIIKGINFWAWGHIAILSALLLISERHTPSDSIVIPAFSSSLIIGLGLALIGTQKFYKSPPTWKAVLFIGTGVR